MYRSYSVNNMPQPIMRRSEKPPEKSAFPKEKSPSKKKADSIFGDLENDDIILLVIILILLMDDCSDKLLIAALGFIFFSDFF